MTARSTNAVASSRFRFPCLSPQLDPVRDAVNHSLARRGVQSLFQRPERRVIARAALRLDLPPPHLRWHLRWRWRWRYQHYLAERHQVPSPDPRRPRDRERRLAARPRRPHQVRHHQRPAAGNFPLPGSITGHWPTATEQGTKTQEAPGTKGDLDTPSATRSLTRSPRKPAYQPPPAAVT